MLRKLFFLLFVISAFTLKSQSIGDSLHVIYYEINLNEVNIAENTISANTKVLLTPVHGDVAGIALELIELTVDSVLIDDELMNFTHENGVVQIPLAESLVLDENIEVSIYYNGTPFHEAWGGFHFSGDYAFNLGVGFESIPHNLGKTWFPCIDNFTDRATYDLFATVENTKTVVGGGLLIETTDNGNGTSTWHWQLTQNIPTYLESVMIGDYVLTTDEYVGIEQTIPIDYYTRPEDVEDIAGTFVDVHEITRFFEDHFGAYPFDRIGFTGTALGAMEHATNISYPYSGFNGNTSSEWWWTHELSHMWFGDNITCSTAEDMWINEGWATFCQIFYLEGIYGHEEFQETMRNQHKDVMLKTHIIDNGYFALNNIPQQYTYGDHAYNKGSVVVNALRNYLGEEVFYDAIKAMQQHFAYQSISSFQMRDFLTSNTGIDMNGFFDTWVFNPGTPHYSIDSTKYSEGQIDIFVKQKYKGAEYIGDHHIMRIAYLKDNFEMVFDTIVFSGATGHSVKQIDFEPINVLVDPEEKMMDATTDNFKTFNTAETYIFPKTYFKLFIEELNEEAFIQATHNYVTPDELKTPVEGLRLSTSHYWKIDGFIPAEMQAQGRFYYDDGAYLDSDIIDSQSDSVHILFRENAADDWHSIPQTRQGIWSVGYIFVDDLRAGEYSLAVYDLTVGESEIISDADFKVFPNPSKGNLKMDFAKAGDYFIKLVDSRGTIVDSISFKGKNKNWKPENNKLGTGTYLLQIFESGKLVIVEKVVFVK